MQKIKAISGMEPHREGEYPDSYIVGYGSATNGPVTSIEQRIENLGSYGIAWFDIFVSDVLIASMNAMAVASVEYYPPDDLAKGAENE